MEVKYKASKGYYDIKWDIVVDDCGRLSVTQTHNASGQALDEPFKLIDGINVPDYVWLSFASAALGTTVSAK